MLAGRASTTLVRISVQIAVYSLCEKSRRPTRLSLAGVKIVKYGVRWGLGHDGAGNSQCHHGEDNCRADAK